MSSTWRLAPLLLLLGGLGCDKPDSVDLGSPCRSQVECKDPADTCLMVAGKQVCTVACSAAKACPERFACARMDVKVEGSDAGDAAGAQGYCLPEAELGSHIATIAPAGRKHKKHKKRRRSKKKGKAAPE